MTNPNHAGSRWVAAVLFSLLSTSAIAAQDKAAAGEAAEPKEELSFLDAFTKGKVNATFNYRFEYVDQDGIANKGYASTLRTTLGYRTEKFQGFQGYLEFEDVSDLGAEDLHNNAGFGNYNNGVTGRPVIADPKGTTAQQYYLDYGYGKSLARYGQQEIILDDARFIGNVGWRQHHQSFDALLLTTQEVENAAFYFAYISKVNAITRRVLDTDTLVFNGHYKFKDVGQLTVYDYYMDMSDPSLYGLSNNIIGAEFKGQRKAGEEWGYRYEAEIASQSDVADNPNSISTMYYHLMLGGIYKDAYGFRLGYEVLGSDNGNFGFQTPLATAHKFNGWADKFLATPLNGLTDLYFKVEGPLGPTKWALIFHSFSADNGGADYGTEFDGIITYKAEWGQNFGFKFAVFSADSGNGIGLTDTTKAWLWTGFKF